MTTPPTEIPDFSRGDGLLPAIAQDDETGDVLMLAWMNRDSYEETLRTSRAVYFSRTRRRELWRKGETSGHFQEVCSIYIDCDADAILLRVRQHGGACHLGYRSCFFRRVLRGGVHVEGPQLFDPDAVYGPPSDRGREA